jgi:hypothetical protein
VDALVTGFGALYQAGQAGNATAGRMEQALYRQEEKLRALTNGAGAVGLNGTNGTSADISGITNLLLRQLTVQQQISNTLGQSFLQHVAGSNLLWQSGNTQVGISNLLYGMGTNEGGLAAVTNLLGQLVDTNKAAWTGWERGSNAWAGIAGSQDSIDGKVETYLGDLKAGAESEASKFSGVVGDSGAYSVDGSVTLLRWTLGGEEVTIECDPLKNSVLAELWGLVKAVLFWAFTAGYYVWIVHWSFKLSMGINMVPQISKLEADVLGMPAGLVSTPFFVGVIMVAVAAVPQLLLAWVTGGAGSGMAASITADPLAGHPALATSIAWFNACFPWQYMLGLVVAGLAFYWQMVSIYMVSAAAIKLCVR